MEKKQASIDWLVEQLIPNAMRMFDATTCNAIEQAKAMHKKEIISTWHKGYDNLSPMIDEYNCGDKYYNETFGGDNE